MNILCSRETIGQKYCMSKKLEQKSFQIMAFAAKLEQRWLKYRSSKRADLRICSWGFLVSTECDFVLFSDAKSNNRTKSD